MANQPHSSLTLPLDRDVVDKDFGSPFGLFGRRKIKLMARRKLIVTTKALEESQLQPASLDLRLSKEAYRVRASFLPGRSRTVKEHLSTLNPEPISLAGDGAVLEKGIVYIARIAEHLALLPSISGAANPKSSTGRLDIFTRLIVNRAEAFDEVPLGYRGDLWLEISPRSFSVRVREGSKLNQIRFRNRNSQQMERLKFALSDDELRRSHALSPLVDRDLEVRDGLVLRVALSGSAKDAIGYRAIKNGNVIDVDRPGGYAAEDFWEPIRARADGRLILDPDEFYILASREKMQIPADLAAEMAPIDPAIGEFRVHYAGFFDPGFGQGANGRPAARAVLEVRSRDVPFLLEDGQPVGRLIFERLADAADELYGAGATSNYQHQGLKLSKHFHS
ncbi:MAG: 2'-deoxycytidine 5'-triphosphate deaminase [Roseiarcus sp.]|uniref:2'-deoxycytidine 5'-triphosphate deaminase n=1 Tax=Roseiarcus sp. TaxID=1969460 RepID=UPI003C602AC4